MPLFAQHRRTRTGDDTLDGAEDVEQLGAPVTTDILEDDASVFVTRPLLPPIAEVIPLLESIWESRMLSNRGPMSDRFEAALAEFLGVDNISLVANGTAGLMVALRALPRTGEIITTPFTFIATGHAILASGCTPKFVDIRPDTYNIDVGQIEAAITDRTVAILPVHCYGGACDVEAIEEIAARHGLKTIYDAAHAFGVERNGRSLLAEGDYSVVSFHATKVFNTFEGGAVVSKTPEDKLRLDQLSNYGLRADGVVAGIGTNAKLNEFSCAVGIASLPHVPAAIEQRRRVALQYLYDLGPLEGLHVPKLFPDQTQNWSYFPLEVMPSFGLSRDELWERLAAENIITRRYFFPTLAQMETFTAYVPEDPSSLAVATTAAQRILCLPIYHDLSPDVVRRVVWAIRSHAGA